MELEDCGFDLLAGVVVTSDPLVAFKDIDVLIGLGAFPRGIHLCVCGQGRGIDMGQGRRLQCCWWIEYHVCKHECIHVCMHSCET